MAVGIAMMTFVVVAKQLPAAYPSLAESLGPLARIDWPRYLAIGTSLTFLAGMLSSLTHPAPPAPPVSPRPEGHA